jgi:hypothetical protein
MLSMREGPCARTFSARPRFFFRLSRRTTIIIPIYYSSDYTAAHDDFDTTRKATWVASSLIHAAARCRVADGADSADRPGARHGP